MENLFSKFSLPLLYHKQFLCICICDFSLAFCFWAAQEQICAFTPFSAYITLQVVSSFGVYLISLNIIMLAAVEYSTLNVTGKDITELNDK